MISLTRSNAIQKAKGLWEARPVFLDTETTGLHNTAEIIEVCVVDWDGSVLLETLVRPRRPIPLDVVRLHGITDKMVKESPSWLQTWPNLEAVLKDRVIGIYNAEFDLRMMQQSHRSNGLPWRSPFSRTFCIMKLFSDYYGSMKWYKLEEAGRMCKIALPHSHRARDDTLLARQVFLTMAQVAGI